jgi:transcriptional regulator with XRE-family HTH domain
MIREKITHYRKQQGLTQTDLASKSGLRQATISDFENGKNNLRSDLLEKIMEVLNLDIVPRS